ncbi:transglycosylase domain-containing protein [Phytoactinopolyspora halotolerans]|uniref:Penicillin-binding protein n=1 Tax=Phytoactinopolyspora halotolerans TaxID=1981512 RepID=A0A6L9S2S0_9ACTN|nr:transglycosylase domain-containing protein [Phytoactinopolyspora halotolerans]NED99110.1 penicillin-binding protein [Phytoactinopolyspora halotolerans]
MASRLAAIVVNLRRSLIVVGVASLSGVLLAGLALPVVAGVGLMARETAQTFQEMPSELAHLPLPERSTVLDADGNVLATFYSENRIYVGLDNIAPAMRDAMLAIEDDRFYDRGPIDFQGTARALIRNVEAGETTGGGSTLTQQYVKLVRLAQAETDAERAEVLESSGIDGYRRKLEELRMAIGVEEQYTKDEIFERYLNIAYFGAGAYGVEAAARAFFSTTAADLTLPQAATIAGLVQSPSATDPTRNPEPALNRRNVVLDRMAETGRITEAEAAQARETDLGLNLSASPNGCVSSYAGFFCDYLLHEVRTLSELGDTPEEREDRLLTGGLTIQATIDRDIQEAADAAIADRVGATDEPIGAAATVEPSSGFIRALSNSRTYGDEGAGSSFINYAVDASMGGGAGIQSGSTFKTWVLAAAIRQGRGVDTAINSPQTIDMSDEPFRICQNGQTVTRDPDYTPANSTGSGTFTMRQATERSVNTYFIELSQRTGLCDPATIAQGAGVYRADGAELRQVPSFALGSNEVSPLAMAGGYGMFANRGMYCPSTSIATITDTNGEVLVDHTDPDCERVLDADVADTVADVLAGVISTPGATGTRMQLNDGRPAAGKTGTTNDSIAVWFAGFTPQLATGVAVADVDGRITSLVNHEFHGDRLGSSGVCGGCIPGPIWKDIMDAAHEDLDVVDFPQPDPETLQGDQPAQRPETAGNDAE